MSCLNNLEINMNNNNRENIPIIAIFPRLNESLFFIFALLIHN